MVGVYAATTCEEDCEFSAGIELFACCRGLTLGLIFAGTVSAISKMWGTESKTEKPRSRAARDVRKNGKERGEKGELPNGNLIDVISVHYSRGARRLSMTKYAFDPSDGKLRSKEHKQQVAMQLRFRDKFFHASFCVNSRLQFGYKARLLFW